MRIKSQAKAWVTAVGAGLLCLGAAQPLSAGQSSRKPGDRHESAIRLKEMAEGITAGSGSDVERAGRIISWLNDNFIWTDTDYQNRTVEEVIERRGGNCAEQVRVARALMGELGIKTRRVAEINVQPRSEQRQKDAEAVIREHGLKASIFGLRHNDHRWIEVYEAETGAWIPADPSLGLIGLREWLAARVSFGERPTHHILPSRDMLVPFAIFALDDRESTILEDRSEYYLIEQFNRFYQGQLETRPSWPAWRQLIAEIVPHAKAAFAWEENLHQQAEVIERVGIVYADLKAESADLH